MSNKTFERLIRLEDEELVGLSESLEDDNLNDKESCKVPMIINGSGGQLDKSILISGVKHKQSRIVREFHFKLNGLHIQMNSEQLKYLSLITLTVQSAALTLTMRAARTQKELFSTPLAVTIAEILKFISCLLLVWYEEISIKGAYRSIRTNIIENYIDTLKVAVPSFVYYIQNNLLYIGSTHLDAATSQVLYQLKILTTAIFSVLILDKKLSRIQWVSLFTLFFGVALIETFVVSDQKSNTNQNYSNASSDISSTKTSGETPMIGFFAVLIACCLSGFAGVYFEKILKSTSHVSLWIRNIQLSVVAIPIGLIQILLMEHEHISNKGLFYGFTPLTWLCIILQVQGGLLVAVVVKFANNILKGFATSMAIVISTMASIFLFNFELTPAFVFGASLVICSVMMYNKQ